MPSSGKLRRVALVRTDVSEEPSASIIKGTILGELGTTLAVTSFLRSVLRLLVTAKVVPSSPILIVFGFPCGMFEEPYLLTYNKFSLRSSSIIL
jgi:hypothetical protein